MDKWTTEVFVREVRTQALFALYAMQKLRQHVAAANNEGVFFYVQAFLGAAGNVSRIMWPSSPKMPNRGQEIRSLLGIPDDSPVSPRRFRNHFEHFDERLEEWANTSKRRNLVDFGLFRPGAIKEIDPEDYMRNLDPANLVLTFRGERYDLAQVEETLTQICHAAENELNRRFSLGYSSR